MRRSARFALAILLVGALAATLRAQISLPPEVAKQGYADTILINGKVVSVDDAGYNTNAGRIYEAMAVKRDRIMALGTTEQIRALANADTKVIDLGGYTILPGIIERTRICLDREMPSRSGCKCRWSMSGCRPPEILRPLVCGSRRRSRNRCPA